MRLLYFHSISVGFFHSQFFKMLVVLLCNVFAWPSIQKVYVRRKGREKGGGGGAGRGGGGGGGGRGGGIYTREQLLLLTKVLTVERIIIEWGEINNREEGLSVRFGIC